MARDAQHHGRGLNRWLHGPRGLHRPCTHRNTTAEPVTQGAETGIASATTTTTQPTRYVPRATSTAGRRRPATRQTWRPGVVAPPPAGGTVGGWSATTGAHRCQPCISG